MAYTLVALPGRLILKFPKAVEKQGLIIVPETSQQKCEFGYIHSIGEPLDDKQRVIVEELKQLQEAGIPLLVTISSGTTYYHGKENAYGKDWEWLADYRSYALETPAVALVEEEDETEAEGVAV